MAALLDLYMKLETLETLVSVLKKKNEKGVSITVSISDETNKFGQNVSSNVSQSDEQRKEKVKPFYTGNGKVFWVKGNVETAKKKEQSTTPQPTTAAAQKAADDLPF